MRRKAKMQARELVSAGWILLVTFLIGLPIVFVDYGEYGEAKEILLLLYLFLEFLPMLVYILAILLPTLSPHLLLPWVVVNVILLLVASILALSLSIPNPTLPIVLIALAISLLLIFPVLFAIIMYLPLIVYVKKLWPKYKLMLKKYKVYRKITGQRTVEEIENEILARRRAQVQATVITEKDFEQFIYVNRAAQKWKTKLKKNRKPVELEEPEEELKDILEEGNLTTVEENGGNVTVNASYEMDCLMQRARAQQSRNGEVVRKQNSQAAAAQQVVTNGGAEQQTTVNHNGKFVTDV